MDRPLALLVFCAPLLLAGCSENVGPATMAQGQWRFARIDGERPVGEAAQVLFSNDRIGVEVGCSRLDGPWHLVADRLVAGPLGQSDAPCPATGGFEGSWDQGNAVGALLVSEPHVSVEGDRMTLNSSGHRVELVRAGA